MSTLSNVDQIFGRTDGQKTGLKSVLSDERNHKNKLPKLKKIKKQLLEDCLIERLMHVSF